MTLYLVAKKQAITFDSNHRIAIGGEGEIYRLAQDESLLAKVYHDPTAIKARKLIEMIANPPEVKRNGHITIAWPIDLLSTDQPHPKVVGFLMPSVTGSSLFRCINPIDRQRHFPNFSYADLHTVAFNIASIVHALHQVGYVVGDINEQNIIVNHSAEVAIIDTDSFQVPDPETGLFYRCPVGTLTLTPPELQVLSFADVDRTPEHDNFGLAILIFHLLMEGYHPFAGISGGEWSDLLLVQRIAAGAFPHGRRSQVKSSPPKFSPPFNVLHPNLQDLFLRCFDDSHDRPEQRPTASDWQGAIQNASQSLIVCSVSDHHLYGNHLPECPWCRRKEQLEGYDSFSSQSKREIAVLRDVSETVSSSKIDTNPVIPESLADSIRSGRCVLFVGAGLSAWAGMPTWSELLWIMVRTLVKEKPNLPQLKGLPDLMEKGKFQEVADFCKKELGSWLFTRILAEHLGKPAVPIPQPHKLIMDLPFFAIVTTNYDKLLEQAYSSLSNGRVPRVATQRDTETLGTLLCGDPGFILKAHGDIDYIEGLIFTSADYRQMIHSNNAFQMLFNAILVSKTVLFIGYSLNDPDFRFLLDGHFTVFKGNTPKRYALMTDISDIEQSNLWDKANMQIITYIEQVELLNFFATLKSLVGSGSFYPRST